MKPGPNRGDLRGGMAHRHHGVLTAMGVVMALFMLCIPAMAQSISGAWIDGHNQIVEVSKSGFEYLGHYGSGPDNGKLALQIRPDGKGGYKGKWIVYSGGPRVHQVSAMLSGSGLELKWCTGPTRRPHCHGETWRRQLQRPPKLPPLLKDGIRKPNPPPVIRRPDLRQQRIPG